ncbi:MAG TPA: zinc ribbon domain-containing protein [Thermoplasmata archaeon]|nr:zinc ribbon domain-containing protein [Thermoplasmata archaeon]HYB77225.1 zinc ribbon domain-containing protein [Thermoplasmata archaeon]
MQNAPYGSMYPRTGYVLSLIGGILIVLFAVAEIAEAIVFSSQIESVVPGATRIAIIAGAITAVLGFTIIFLAFRLKSSPGTSRTTGVVIVVLAILSFFGGGGLFIGLILAFIGGIVAMTWRPPALPQTMYGEQGYNAPIRQPGGPIPWQSSTPAPASPEAGQRYCMSCGSPVVAGAQFCAKCGAPVP